MEVARGMRSGHEEQQEKGPRDVFPQLELQQDPRICALREGEHGEGRKNQFFGSLPLLDGKEKPKVISG